METFHNQRDVVHDTKLIINKIPSNPKLNNLNHVLHAKLILGNKYNCFIFFGAHIIGISLN